MVGIGRYLGIGFPIPLGSAGIGRYPTLEGAGNKGIGIGYR